MRLRLLPALLLLAVAQAAPPTTGSSNARPLDDAAYDAAVDDAARSLQRKKRLFTTADLEKAARVRELALELPAAGTTPLSGKALFATAAKGTLILAVRGESEEDTGEAEAIAPTARTLAARRVKVRRRFEGGEGAAPPARRAGRRAVAGGGGDATAFLIADSGVIVTCLHALPDDGAPFVIAACTVDGRVVAVRDILMTDKENDLAFLRVDNTTAGLVALPLAADVAAGESVRVMGHPWSRYFHLTDGIVARHSRTQPGEGDEDAAAPRPPLIDITADIAEGSSGAAVLDTRGAVVGVAQAYALETTEEGEVVFKHRTAIPAAAVLGKIRVQP